MVPVVSRLGVSSRGIVLVWVTGLVSSAVYGTILLRGNYPKGTDIRGGLKTWHFRLGLAVRALIVMRLRARLASRQPTITPEPPVWQALLASTTHFALYAFMVAMPVAGWVILSASGKTIRSDECRVGK